jgi:6-phosphofructokinase 1
MVLEVMGRYAGWIALFAGVAGGADVILIPEIPFSYESVSAKIQERENLGKKFTIIIVAEGAREKDGGFITSGAHTKTGEVRLGGLGGMVSAEIEKRTGKESRVCVLGHLQRGGSPTTFDRALCSIFGATAVELIAAGEFGKMVAFTGPQVDSIKISDAVGKLKAVNPNGNLLRTARALGICFGD